jgi:integrase
MKKRENIFRPWYKDKKTGEKKQSAIYWIRYSHNGVKYRESSKCEKEADARALLKKRLGQAGLGKPVTTAVRRTTLDDLANAVFTDYRNNEYDTLARQEDAFSHLREFFGGDCRAEAITTSRILEYIEWRREQPNGLFTRNPRIGCSNATINRELASLRHAFKLASQYNPPLVGTVPHIQLLKERNRRTGFFEWPDFAAVREHLPDYLKPVMTTAYYTGWRAPSEILTRQIRHVIGDKLVLEAYETKNEQPREFPLDMIPELREAIDRQLELTRKLELETGRVIPLLFHNQGRPIVDYRPAWHKACAASGVAGRIPHDFRRTAARNLINAGVDPLVTMALVGWEDIGMLKRYGIIDENMLRRGAEKLNAYLDEQKRRPAKVTALSNVK